MNNLAGVNIILEGPTGTGKTYSLGTLVETGLEVFYLAMESGMESLLGYWIDTGKPIPQNLHWHRIKPSEAGFAAMLANAKVINSLSSEAVMKVQDPNKAKHNQFVTLLEVFNNFTDQRTGKTFGAVDTWEPDKVLVIDALTGINIAALSLVAGAKPSKTLAEWGRAMDQVETLLRQLTDSCRCHFVLLSHVEREVDQVLGGVKITVGTLGTKLASKIPPMFSDVILAYREGTKFLWSTANPQADLKARNLSLADGLPADFRPIIAKWRARNEASITTV